MQSIIIDYNRLPREKLEKIWAFFTDLIVCTADRYSSVPRLGIKKDGILGRRNGEL